MVAKLFQEENVKFQGVNTSICRARFANEWQKEHSREAERLM